MYAAHVIVMDEMEMENTVPRVGIEPTSLAFWASMLALQHIGSLMSPLYLLWHGAPSGGVEAQTESFPFSTCLGMTFHASRT